MKNLAARLRSKKGLTLTELLVAILVMSLTGAMLAVGISSSVRIYNRLTVSSEAEVLADTLETAISDELRYAKDIVIISDGASFTSERAGRQAGIVTTADGYVRLISTLDDGTRHESDLIPKKAFTSGLAASASVKYESAEKLFAVKLIVSTGSAGQVWKDYTFWVKPMNPPS